MERSDNGLFLADVDRDFVSADVHRVPAGRPRRLRHMNIKDVTGEDLISLGQRVDDPVAEVELVRNIHLYVKDAHDFASAYSSYCNAVRELCSGNPEPVSVFLRRWPHKQEEIIFGGW